MLTYQDYLKAADKLEFLRKLISQHKTAPDVKTALVADAYDRRRNITINEYVQKVYTLSGLALEDYVASNNKIASNFFRHLNTQRASYLLGNGVSFQQDGTKDKLGQDFDTQFYKAGRLALIHGVSFIFFNVDRIHVFKLTEFAPLFDEETGALRAGIRYWKIDPDKPMSAVFYEEDGYTTYKAESGDLIQPTEEKHGYRQKVRVVPADETPEIIGEDNYGTLPIVPLYGSSLKQSTLIGMREQIDSYDLIRSGFANDLQDCAQIYWLLENYGGMTAGDIAKFRDQLLFQHMAVADTDSGKITPYTQDIPYQARMAFLENIRDGIYEDFGAVDVSKISSQTKTATEIRASYQPLDEEADDFEFQCIESIQAILALIGIEDTPTFQRNMIVNQLEQVQLVIAEAEYLDDETVLRKLPNITVDEIENILAKKDAEDASRAINFETGNESGEE